MNIAIIGYGKMGKIIEQIALERKHIITAIIDTLDSNATHKEISAGSLEGADVCIDFSNPNTAIENITKVSALKKNIVVGTTNWYNSLEEARKIISLNQTGLIYASNFSVGVNIFFRIVDFASKQFNKIAEYDAYVFELHHNKKLDSPSGTANSIAQIMLKNLDRKQKIAAENLDRKINPDELHVAAIRAGSIPGTHIAGFDSEADNIELKHEARTRKGFALGAVMAAEWLVNRKGFYTIDDLMNDVLG